MICTPCNGSGLISQTEVCPTCKGLGNDGITTNETPMDEVIETPIETVTTDSPSEETVEAPVETVEVAPETPVEAETTTVEAEAPAAETATVEV